MGMFLLFLTGLLLLFLFYYIRQSVSGNAGFCQKAWRLEKELDDTYLPQSDYSTQFIVTLEKRIVWTIVAFFGGGASGAVAFTIFFFLVSANLYGSFLSSQIWGLATAIIMAIFMQVRFRTNTARWNYLDANTSKDVQGERYPCQILEWGIKTEKLTLGRKHFMLCKYAYTRDCNPIEGIFRVQVPTAKFNPEDGTNIWLCKGSTAKHLAIEGLGRYKSARVMVRSRKDAFDKMKMDDY